MVVETQEAARRKQTCNSSSHSTQSWLLNQNHSYTLTSKPVLPLYCLGPPYSQRMIWSQQAAIAGSDAAAQEFAPGPLNTLRSVRGCPGHGYERSNWSPLTIAKRNPKEQLVSCRHASSAKCVVSRSRGLWGELCRLTMHPRMRRRWRCFVQNFNIAMHPRMQR